MNYHFCIRVKTCLKLLGTVFCSTRKTFCAGCDHRKGKHTSVIQDLQQKGPKSYDIHRQQGWLWHVFQNAQHVWRDLVVRHLHMLALVYLLSIASLQSTPTGTRTRNLVHIRHETRYKLAALTIELWGHVPNSIVMPSGIVPQFGLEPKTFYLGGRCSNSLELLGRWIYNIFLSIL